MLVSLLRIRVKYLRDIFTSEPPSFTERVSVDDYSPAELSVLVQEMGATPDTGHKYETGRSPSSLGESLFLPIWMQGSLWTSQDS